MRLIVVLALAVVTAGCSAGQIVGGGIPAADALPAPFPECLAEEYLYVGENSLARLGLDDDLGVSHPDATRAGKVWVTADFVPADFGLPVGGEPELRQMVCISFADGSGMSGALAGPWEQPGMAAADGGNDSSTALPIGLLLGAGLIVILAVVSLFAFRRPPDSGRT